MNQREPNIQIPVDLTNPGQFFACCGLLELADRIWPGAEGWFSADQFYMKTSGGSLDAIVDAITNLTVSNTMKTAQRSRLDQLSAMKKKDRSETMEEEKKALESLRRELPIVLTGKIALQIDWFTDDLAGGSRFKTWAGQQSVIDIAQAMHRAGCAGNNLWSSQRGIGVPFNFDSDLGGQGSGIDIGFVFDALAGSDITRIEGACRPGIELLCFIGLQRFRPREIPRQNRFVFTAWNLPLLPSIAAAVACDSVRLAGSPRYEFKLLYRTKYLKSFLPAIPFQGDRDE